MPVRRKHNKRRATAGYDDWLTPLETGFDLFNELSDAGVQTDASSRPDREAARLAWRLHGAQIMAERDPQLGPPWAQMEFGEP